MKYESNSSKLATLERGGEGKWRRAKRKLMVEFSFSIMIGSITKSRYLNAAKNMKNCIGYNYRINVRATPNP